MPIVRRQFIALVSMALLVVTLAGCSSGGNSSASSSTTPTSTYPAGKEQLCQARDQLKSSIDALTKPSLLTSGTSGIQQAVSKVSSDVDAVTNAARSAYQPQVSTLQASLHQLQTAVTNLGNGNVTQNLQVVGTAIANVGSAAGALLTQLKASCG